MATITLGMQTSGEDDRTNAPVLELRRLLAECCAGPYSSDVREFALILRIAGEMQEFDFEGCERIRRNRKGRYITLDLGVPSYRWKGVGDSDLREYLAQTVETGLLCCINRLERDKTPIASSALMSDYAKVKKRFLGELHS